MTMPTGQLLWLTLLGVIRNGEPDCNTENISCRCGTTSSTVLLSNNLSCKESAANEDPCIAFQNCKTCRSGLDRCLTCPKGKFGSFCTEVSECGNAKQLTRRIANGDVTNEGDWPWHVGLSRHDGRDWSIYCGGVLITSTAVLTAAHCLSSRTASDYRLYLGKYFRNLDDDDEEVVIRTPSELIIHHRYNISAPLDSDIAVIRFSPAVSFTDRIRPICLPSAETSRKHLVHGNKGWVTGWGLTENQLASDVLLVALLPVVSTPNCKEAYRQAGIKLQITKNMFCAGSDEGRTSACGGDSGGPMMFLSKDNRYVLEGLVSFGPEGECGQPKQYSVYTKVQNYLNWIRQNT